MHAELTRSAEVCSLQHRDGGGRRQQSEVTQIAAEGGGRRAGGRVLDHPAGRERVTRVIGPVVLTPHELHAGRSEVDVTGTAVPIPADL